MSYPSILNFPSPEIKVYSLESAIAEKLEAIVSLGTLSSRMKDYFDVYFIINNQNLNKKRLKKAVETTFEERNTPLSDIQYIFNEEFKNEESNQQQWQAFLNRTSVVIDHPFAEIVTTIEEYVNYFLVN